MLAATGPIPIQVCKVDAIGFITKILYASVEIQQNWGGLTYSDQQHIKIIPSKESVGPFYYSFIN